eukprot:m.843094 g.843094  ORF g.843094 m.843094 type:complete len:192 (+) comp23472_c0_seq7:181-756(+)
MRWDVSPGKGGVPLVAGALCDVRADLAAHIDVPEATPVSVQPSDRDNDDVNGCEHSRQASHAGDTAGGVAGDAGVRPLDNPEDTSAATETPLSAADIDLSREIHVTAPEEAPDELQPGDGQRGGGATNQTHLVLPEDRVLGVVTWSTYKYYMKHAGCVRPWQCTCMHAMRGIVPGGVGAGGSLPPHQDDMT